jgi:hypothetical protein
MRAEERVAAAIVFEACEFWRCLRRGRRGLLERDGGPGSETRE